MTNIEALLALYEALGGESTDTYESIAGGIPVSNYKLLSDMIQAIAEIVEGKTLPEVDASDNGSVLKVADGAWAVVTDET